MYTPLMGHARMLHASVLLGDGTVLAIGGLFGCHPDGTGCSGLTAVDQYQPGTPGRVGEQGTWMSAPHLLDARAAHTATALLDGTILVVGGLDFIDGGALDSAERYFPALPDLSGCALPLAAAAIGAAGLVYGITRRGARRNQRTRTRPAGRASGSRQSA
jgi:hypothetical protein